MADLTKLTHEEVLYLLSLLPEDSTILRDKLEIFERRLRPAPQTNNRITINLEGRKAEIDVPTEIWEKHGEQRMLELARRQGARIFKVEESTLRVRKERQNGHFVVIVNAEKLTGDLKTLKAVASRMTDAEREELKAMFS